jgi:nucleoside-diphosphate-sugar epimerase
VGALGDFFAAQSWRASSLGIEAERDSIQMSAAFAQKSTERALFGAWHGDPVSAYTLINNQIYLDAGGLQHSAPLNQEDVLMRVFVTGATGFVGSAVVSELLRAGHAVLGLARTDEAAAALHKAGAGVHRGSMEDLDSLRAGVDAADGVIHTAFNHDFSRFAENALTESRAVDALGEALRGSERPLIVTSGFAMLSAGPVCVETDEPIPPSDRYPRASEATAMKFVDAGVRVSVVRLPPTVHGQGDHGFVPRVIAFARQHGVSPYIGDGSNRWAAVHRYDAAHVFRLALERAASGGRYHAVAEEGIPFRQIADTVGKQLGVSVVSVSKEQAPAHFEWLAPFVGMTMAASSERTRETLGWTPSHPELLADLRDAGYFD